MSKGIIDLYRMRVKKNIDAIVAVTKQGYCDHLDYGLWYRYMTFTIRNYNPRSPPQVVSYPHSLTDYNNPPKKDLQDVYIISFDRKQDINKTIGFIKVPEGFELEEKSIRKRIIASKDVPYTKSNFKKDYTKRLISIASKRIR